jgi:hypothetical protein
LPFFHLSVSLSLSCIFHFPCLFIYINKLYIFSRHPLNITLIITPLFPYPIITTSSGKIGFPFFSTPILHIYTKDLTIGGEVGHFKKQILVIVYIHKYITEIFIYKKNRNFFFFYLSISSTFFSYFVSQSILVQREPCEKTK